MEYREIRQLTEKYWACETSREEEQVLKAFFTVRRDDLPDDLKEAAALFGFWKEEAGIRVDDPAWEAELQSIPVGREGRSTILSRMRPLWKYAAVLLMAAGAFYFTVREHPAHDKRLTATVMQDSYQDPQKAFEETRRALMIVSAHLNQGKVEMEKLSRFNEAQEKISRPE